MNHAGALLIPLTLILGSALIIVGVADPERGAEPVVLDVPPLEIEPEAPGMQVELDLVRIGGSIMLRWPPDAPDRPVWRDGRLTGWASWGPEPGRASGSELDRRMARLGAVTPQSFELGVTIFASDVFEQWGRFVVKQLLTEANGDPAEKVKPDRGAEAEEGETAEP